MPTIFCSLLALLVQQLFKKMAQSGAPATRASLESGAFTFHYIIDNDVCYLTLVEKSYPKKLAYQYLEELQREFFSLYGREIEQAKRPYAFIKFGMLQPMHTCCMSLVCIFLHCITRICMFGSGCGTPKYGLSLI